MVHFPKIEAIPGAKEVVIIHGEEVARGLVGCARNVKDGQSEVPSSSLSIGR